MSNAIKFTLEGGITLSAHFNADTDEISIGVQDSGIGITPDDLEHLFKPFSRLDTPLKITTTGTGLGLYLTRKLATEILGGDVRVESEPDTGSCFYLEIPRRVQQ
jgi:signal transduction histidine kinase